MTSRWKTLGVVHAVVIATAGAFVLVGQSLADRWEVRELAYAAVAGLVTVLSLSLFFAHRYLVGRPLRRIIEGAERLAKGDRNHRIDLEGEGEFAQAAQAINRLADQVARSHQVLEAQVEERTADLRAVLAEVHERSRIAEEVNRTLAEVDRRRSEFLGNVSHELRTPLNSILGFLRLLQDGMYENEEEAREYVENARFAASHLLQLVTDVLSAGQLEAGRMKVDPRPLHPGDVLCDVLRIMEFHSREKRVRLKLEVDGKAIVFADEQRLRQILVNLVHNAIKFTDDGDVVIRTRAHGDEVLFEVEDTGAGIPPDELEKIFDKFHQVDSPMSRAHGGTGMGLAICRQLVQRMGGAIGAYSEGPGCGSRLWFTLPTPARAEPESAAAAADMK